MKAFAALIAFWTLAALLGRASRRIGLRLSAAIAAVAILGFVVADFVISTPDPWSELYHGGPGPLPIRLIIVFGLPVTGLALLACVPAMFGRIWWPAATARRRLVCVLVAVAVAGAALVPTIRLTWTIDSPVVLAASPTQALIFVPSRDLGAARSPASWLGLFARQLLGSWESGVMDGRSHLTLFVVEDGASRRLEIPGDGRFMGIGDNAVHAIAGGRLSRWTGDSFVPVSKLDVQQYRATWNGTAVTVPGWTLRRLTGPGDPMEASFTTDGVSYRLLASSFGRRATLDLVQAQAAARRLWPMNDSPRVVSRSEYEQLFDSKGARP